MLFRSKQGLLPGTISSDLHQFNIHGPVFDLATTLSKFLHLGLTLEQVIARVTTHPAKTFGFAGGLGTTAVNIFRLTEHVSSPS